MRAICLERIVAPCVCLVALAGCGGSGSSTPAPSFVVTNLVSDQGGQATLTDTNLVNPWGLAINPAAGAFWVADNGTGVASLYTGDVAGSALATSSLVVTIPGGSPTGQVYNPTTDFVVTSGVDSGPATFIFCSEAGTITGWNPNVPLPPPSTTAQTGATVAGAVYKGLAIGNDGAANHLYATNFKAGTIDVFDTTYTVVPTTGSFTDPGLPSGYGPFGIVNVGGTLYVSYALRGGNGIDDVPGPGNGYVDRFDLSGNFLGRLVTRGGLNSPWGMVIAPSSFGSLAGALLVGNFGDGKINAYNASTGLFMGTLSSSGSPIVIDGLWALAVGNGVSAGDTTAVYFTAGTGGEAHGTFGKIAPP